MMATNTTGKQPSSQTMTTTEPPFWRLPAKTTSAAAVAGSSTSSISPEIVVTPTLPPSAAFVANISGGNAYSTAIEESTSPAAAAVPVTVGSAAGQQQQQQQSAAASFQFCRSGGSCSASAATTTTSCLAVGRCGAGTAAAAGGGPRWTDRRNLTQVQEADLQDKIRHLVAECEKTKPNGGGLMGTRKKKKLLLEGMLISEADIPVEDILLGVDYRDKYQTGSSTESVTVAPQWIKAAQAASMNNKGASKGDSHGTQATANTNTSSSMLTFSVPEGRNSASKKSGSSSSTPLAKNLHTLSLARNRYLVTIPQKLVSGSMVSGAKLAQLQHLDLSSCAISKLPDERTWDLPQLKRLNLALNRLHDFPNQNVLGGLPQLKELNLYGNRLAEIQGCSGHHSSNSNSKLVLLNVAYNDLVCLPETLPFPRLQSLIASHNFLVVIPQALVLSTSTTTPLSCSSPQQLRNNNNNKRRPAPLPRLRLLDVTSNPVTEPPAEVCEAGLTEMRRYYKMHPQHQDSALSSSRRACGAAAAAAAERRRMSHQETSGCIVCPLLDMVSGHHDHSHDENGCLGGVQLQQEESRDLNALFQQQLQQSSTSQQPQGLLSQRRRPSNEVPLYISVESSTLAT